MAAQTLGVVAESSPGETRVAATPATVGQLLKLGYDVVVESGAGTQASFADEAFVAAGARIAPGPEVWASDIVLKVNAPSAPEITALADGATLVSLISPAANPALVESLTKRPITVLAMDAVPRISRAQSMDVLSSMANIAGYRAVIEAAHAFGRLFGGQVTAAGKMPPAKVLIAGAGVAGLAAIAAANSLGAVVRATDPRPEVAEQVGSLGGEFLAVNVEQEASTDGYAKATSADYDAAAAALYAAQAADVDIVITTALIPGRAAPTLLTAEHVASMKPGSVIVDMATAQGGNVAGSVAGRSVVTENGVTIIGYTDLAGRLPAQASQLYGTNLVNLMKLLTPEKDGQLVLDFDDVVQRTMTVVRDGEKTWPPPPVAVTAAPKPAAGANGAVAASGAATGGTVAGQGAAAAAKATSPARRALVPAIAAVALFAIIGFAPSELTAHFTVFVLAIVIGYYVIGNVHHALHTPLMSVTNAISGIIVVGALLQIGHDQVPVTVLASIAILLASINIFGGFAVTRRMLAMFSRS
ncbi:Re/Si-specific NAD(P)(+) transhydrogenase subunit alpha [Cryptosporangium sp. NPDC048952]|uniref:Re/Si-specific NAD(P)(+) transhydrogenase subunit alpha n=1 Tax=Cryptosporangium sp. NPDC048952 TaxID=3363961 RepID=UPI00372001B1